MQEWDDAPDQPPVRQAPWHVRALRHDWARLEGGRASGFRRGIRSGGGILEPMGLEPTTSCMPCKRSPN